MKPFRPQIFTGMMSLTAIAITSIVVGVSVDNCEEIFIVAGCATTGIAQLLPKLVERDE